MNLRGRIEKLENSVTTVPEPPPEAPETEEARLARREFQDAFAAFREQRDDELEKTARVKFRAWIRVARGGAHGHYGVTE